MEQVIVTRDEFEAATEWKIQQLVMWSEQAVEKAGLTWATLDTVLMVGGSSRLRRMGLALGQASGKTPILGREPDLMVALGAAVLARGQVRRRRPAGGLVEAPRGGLVEVGYKRIITRSLGTRVVTFDGPSPRIATAMVIPHGTQSPVSRSRDDFEVSSDGQPCFDVPVVEFERDDDIDVVGNYRFTCGPSARKGDKITITFHYDVSGIVTVEAVDRRSGQPLPVERLPYQEPRLDEVTIRVKPRWVVFALDTSGSMDSDNKIATARKALLDNARSLLDVGGAGCRVGLVTFASDVSIACRPTADVAVIERALDAVRATGTTSMDEGIRQAVELVMAAPAGTDRDVVMVTDGMPDDDRRRQTLAMAAEALRKGVTLSNLGVGQHGVDLDFLKELSPLSLVIGTADTMSETISHLLGLPSRGGLTEPPRGGLRDADIR